MRHRKKKGILDRKKSSREALLRSLAGHLIDKEKIITTMARAKILKSLMEKLITTAKNNTIVNKREIKKFVYQENLLKKLFLEIVPQINKNKGGYLKISKLGNRKGDNAPLVQIEILKKNESKQSSKAK